MNHAQGSHGETSSRAASGEGTALLYARAMRKQLSRWNGNGMNLPAYMM